jgi:hypothetical protein
MFLYINDMLFLLNEASNTYCQEVREDIRKEVFVRYMSSVTKHAFTSKFIQRFRGFSMPFGRLVVLPETVHEYVLLCSLPHSYFMTSHQALHTHTHTHTLSLQRLPLR